MPFSAFVPAVAPLSTGKQTAFLNGLRPRAARNAVCTPSRRSIIRAAVPLEVEESTFDSEVLGSEIPVLVDFYAAWCGPCKLVAPLMDWAASQYDGKLKVVKVDTDANEKFVKEYGIHGLPTFAVFKEGVAYGVQEGAMGKDGLEKYIASHVPDLAA